MTFSTSAVVACCDLRFLADFLTFSQLIDAYSQPYRCRGSKFACFCGGSGSYAKS